jgi:hypothetical protein
VNDDSNDVVYFYPPPPPILVTNVLERLSEFVECLEVDHKEDLEWELMVLKEKCVG